VQPGAQRPWPAMPTRRGSGARRDCRPW
jgi:hypothetical protein